MKNSVQRACWTVAAAALLAPIVGAEDAPIPIAIGAAAPTFAKLPNALGDALSSAEVADAKVVVLAFTCNSCPFAVDYEDRFIEFAREYKNKGVAFIAINCNGGEADALPQMKSRGEQKGFTFPYLFDETQQVAKGFGAKVTPHLFVLDGERKLAYRGAFDNARKTSKVTKHYVRDAVDSLLGGKSPVVAETRASGCSIKYE